MLPHDRPLSEVEFVAFDLETTRLFPVVNRIVEFGFWLGLAVDHDVGRILMTTLLNLRILAYEFLYFEQPKEE